MKFLSSGPDKVGRKELRQKLILFSQDRFAGVVPRKLCGSLPNAGLCDFRLLPLFVIVPFNKSLLFCQTPAGQRGLKK